MKEPVRLARNQARILELHPSIQPGILGLLARLETPEGGGFRPRIQEAWRSPADQSADYEKKVSSVPFGFHNLTGAAGEKLALAVDLLNDDDPVWPKGWQDSPGPARAKRIEYSLRLALYSREAGFRTGILWGLPPEKRKAIEAALAASDFSALVRIGWDPLHVETAALSLEDLKAGRLSGLGAPPHPEDAAPAAPPSFPDLGPRPPGGPEV